MNFIKIIEYWTSIINNNLWSFIVLPTIIFLGIYFTFKSRFIQFRLFKHIIKLVTQSQNKNKNEISSLQALLTALGGRVGGGNLAGVGIALFLGGPGAIFWMITIALFMMAVAIIEVTLGQIYKIKQNNSSIYLSGVPFYMRYGLNQKILPIIFAICISIQMSSWNALQASYLDTYFTKIFNTSQIFNSIFIVGIIGTIIFGGAKWIIKACEKIVPLMATFYLLLAAYVIIVNISDLPTIITTIISEGMGIKQLMGGTAGYLFADTIRNGIRRGIYSNEAAVGSMPTLGGLSKVKHPVKQGLIDSIGVFLDTVVICTATSIIILTANVLGQNASNSNDLGSLLIQKAFGYHFGDWAGYFLIIAFFTFSSTSVIANHCIGENNLKYINNKLGIYYRIWGVALIFYGSIASVKGIVHIADTLMGLSVTLHLITIFRLRKKALSSIKDYEKQLKNKKDEPIFNSSKIIPDLKSEIWI